ncbi:hypothetical protein RAH41_21360 [Gottfriedia acidiceleris]|uniref:hypothetical protein n=1 Tax=Gottfriedia acidiceleris TaxID=371036 RepID=UPI002F26B00A
MFKFKKDKLEFETNTLGAVLLTGVTLTGMYTVHKFLQRPDLNDVVKSSVPTLTGYGKKILEMKNNKTLGN